MHPTCTSMLTFSTDEWNLDFSISDDHDRILYVVSSSGVLPTRTAVEAHRPDGNTEMLSIITWNGSGSDKIWLGGSEINAEELLRKRRFSSSRVFIGPDNHTYKWKIQTPSLWLKRTDTSNELARYHERNRGITSPAHPPRLQISSELLAHMLDYIVVTFIYVQMLSLRARRRQRNRAWMRWT
ncbi:hypothetical protein V8B97DRAFT_21216 [Scleroderma yunnanense]